MSKSPCVSGRRRYNCNAEGEDLVVQAQTPKKELIMGVEEMAHIVVHEGLELLRSQSPFLAASQS
jgi:hypothetical protein